MTLRLLHQLLLVRKYEKPERVGSILLNPAWRTDNSRSLWEVVQSSPEADAELRTPISPDWIVVTPPRSGVFVDYDALGRELYVIHAESVVRIIPWTEEGKEMQTLGARVLVRPDTPPAERGGIVLSQAHAKRPVTGVVEDVGPDVQDVVRGDRVMYTIYSGTDVELDGTRFVLMGEDQVLMKLDAGTEVGA